MAAKTDPKVAKKKARKGPKPVPPGEFARSRPGTRNTIRPAPGKRHKRRGAKALLTQPPSAIQPAERNDVIERAMRKFEQELGGREELISLLAHVDHDEAEERLINLMVDPEYGQRSLVSLLALSDCSVSRFFKFFAKADGARAHLTALRSVNAKIPRVADEAMDAALNQTVKCLDCNGTGQIGKPPKTSECARCEGTGEVRVVADREDRKIALQLSGLLKKDGGVNVSLQQNQLVMSGRGDSFDKFAQATDKLLYGDSEVVDAQVVDVGRDEEEG